jgi:hypothetical protein
MLAAKPVRLCFLLMMVLPSLSLLTHDPAPFCLPQHTQVSRAVSRRATVTVRAEAVSRRAIFAGLAGVGEEERDKSEGISRTCVRARRPRQAGRRARRGQAGSQMTGA